MNHLSKLIRLIYPPRCAVCREFLPEDREETFERPCPFCRSCLSRFRTITSPLCTICGKPFVSDEGEDHTCGDCIGKRTFYEAARGPYLYEGPLMEAVHQLKYGGKAFLADYLGGLLADFAEGWVKTSPPALTMPVPLHPARLRQRGFNQSLLLARYVADRLKTPLDFLSLRRIRYTAPQTGLGMKERRKNVRSAFEVINPAAVKGRRLLLVDDVTTTGSTLNECARAIKKGGGETVICLVLTRTGNT
jgi:ComF family protein